MYKNAISEYPVSTGDIWQSKEGHTLYCGDNLIVPIITRFNIIYTDPPWTNQILRQFYRWSSTDETIDFFAYIKYFCYRMSDLLTATGIIFIEMGVKGHETIKEHMAKHLLLQAEQDARYGKNTPMKISAWSRCSQKVTIQGGEGMAMSRANIQKYVFPDTTFLEPCAGEGYQAEMALLCGAKITCIELIPSKFASMLKRLSKHTTFERTGTWVK